MTVIFALSHLANTPEGQTVLAAGGGVVYDLVRRYSKTKLPGGLLWDLHRGLRWVADVSGNAASAMDGVAGQNLHPAEGVTTEDVAK